MKTRRGIFLLIILVNFCPLNSQGQTPQRAEENIVKSSPFSLELVRRQAERVKFSRIQRLVDALGIKSGMTIVDIGAGSGGYAYKFAERLKETGRVFATDMDVDMIKYLSEQAQKRNLVNILPVLVKSEGLDEFYTKEKFDLVFIAHAYMYIRDRINFFKGLKGSISQNGRLVVLHNKNIYDFSLSDVSDFDGLIKHLSSEKSDSPFFLCLQESTRQLLHIPLEDKANGRLRKAIIVDFNRMANDIYFLSYFLKDSLTFKRRMHFLKDERDYVYWALRFLRDEEKIFDNTGAPNIKKMTPKHLFFMKLINTVLIVQEFRKYLYDGKPAPYLPHGYADWQNYTIPEELSSAGYSLKQQYDFIPFESILVFSPDRSAD